MLQLCAEYIVMSVGDGGPVDAAVASDACRRASHIVPQMVICSCVGKAGDCIGTRLKDRKVSFYHDRQYTIIGASCGVLLSQVNFVGCNTHSYSTCKLCNWSFPADHEETKCALL